MKTCVVKSHRAGLFSNINKVITALRIYDQVHVDWSDSIYGDCWNDLFAPTTFLTTEGYDTIVDYPFYDLTAACAGVLYQNEGWGWRQKFHPLWEKLQCKIKPFTTVGSEVTGILVRSEGHRGEQLSDRTQTYDEYAKEIDPRKPVFVLAQDEETRAWFKQRFATVFPPFTTKLNAKRSDPDRHLTTPQTVEDAIQVMREVLTLATCSTLIHPISNMATTALIINPSMKSVYLK